MTKEDLKKVIASNQNSSASHVHLLFDEPETLSHSILDLLQLEKSNLTGNANLLVEILENDKDFGCHQEYQKFKWMILAYLNTQDAFPSSIYDDYDEKILFSRYYFYYEGLSILREYFYCGLNNMIVSANHLIRTFIEFNLRQCYYFEKCKREGSFAPIKQYLKKGIAPSNQSIVEYLFPSNSFCKPIKKSIQMTLKGLSKSSSHAFDPLYSTRVKLGHEYSIDSLLFWLRMFSSFNTVLWSYYVVFPTLLKPRDVIRKFGFNFIPGLFITNSQHIAIKKSFNQSELEIFCQNDPIKTELQALDDVYNGFSDLSDEEIISTWTKKEKLEGFLPGYAVGLAEMRAINELLSNKFTVEKNETPDFRIETELSELTKYEFWKKNYKKL